MLSGTLPKDENNIETIKQYFAIAKRIKETKKQHRRYLEKAPYYSAGYDPSIATTFIETMENDVQQLETFLTTESEALSFLKKSLLQTTFACMQIILETKIAIHAWKFDHNLVIDEYFKLLELHCHYLHNIETQLIIPDENASLFESTCLPTFNKDFKVSLVFGFSTTQLMEEFFHFIEHIFEGYQHTIEPAMKEFFNFYYKLTSPANRQQAIQLLEPFKTLMQIIKTMHQLQNKSLLDGYDLPDVSRTMLKLSRFITALDNKVIELEKLIEANNKLGVTISSNVAPLLALRNQIQEKDLLIAKQQETINTLIARVSQLETSFNHATNLFQPAAKQRDQNIEPTLSTPKL